MYTVTKIEQQKKDLKRVSVFINGEFDFGVTEKAIERYGLFVGQELTEEAYQQLLERMQLDKAKYKALDYLASHHKTEKQVRDKLLKAEYSQVIVDQVIEFLKKYNYIDDKHFAKRYIESKATYGRKSARQIQSLLYAKGISGINPFEIEPNLEEIEGENIRYFLEKYRYNSDLEYTARQKIISKLLNKGFSYQIIQRNLVNLDESFEG